MMAGLGNAGYLVKAGTAEAVIYIPLILYQVSPDKCCQVRALPVQNQCPCQQTRINASGVGNTAKPV